MFHKNRECPQKRVLLVTTVATQRKRNGVLKAFFAKLTAANQRSAQVTQFAPTEDAQNQNCAQRAQFPTHKVFDVNVLRQCILLWMKAEPYFSRVEVFLPSSTYLLKI
jgi:hypothetical protein